jgi:hypothetical protein
MAAKDVTDGHKSCGVSLTRGSKTAPWARHSRGRGAAGLSCGHDDRALRVVDHRRPALEASTASSASSLDSTPAVHTIKAKPRVPGQAFQCRLRFRCGDQLDACWT